MESLPAVSYVIPTRNSSRWIKQTFQRLCDELESREGSEIIFVENGSTDNTFEIVGRLQKESIQKNVKIFIIQAENYGDAIRKGVSASNNQKIVVSADDLPFDFSDLYEFDKSIAPVVLGSKMHKNSMIFGRRYSRRILSRACQLFCMFVMRVDGEVNGTLLLQREGIELLLSTKEKGFAINLELFRLAKKNNVSFSRVPIRYEANMDITRVFFVRDSIEYMKAGFRILIS